MYYGFYSSANNDGRSFVTEPQDDLMFPPQVVYNGASFRYVRAYQVSTPSQITKFEEWCVTHAQETDVSIK